MGWRGGYVNVAWVAMSLGFWYILTLAGSVRIPPIVVRLARSPPRPPPFPPSSSLSLFLSYYCFFLILFLAPRYSWHHVCVCILPIHLVTFFSFGLVLAYARTLFFFFFFFFLSCLLHVKVDSVNTKHDVIPR